MERVGPRERPAERVPLVCEFWLYPLSTGIDERYRREPESFQNLHRVKSRLGVFKASCIFFVFFSFFCPRQDSQVLFFAKKLTLSLLGGFLKNEKLTRNCVLYVCFNVF